MLNTDVLWSIKNQNNLYGDFTYDAENEKTIKCRVEPHTEEVKDSQGRIHISKHIYYTREKVELDDKLNGELVVSKYDMNTLGGAFHLRRLITV